MTRVYNGILESVLRQLQGKVSKIPFATISPRIEYRAALKLLKSCLT